MATSGRSEAGDSGSLSGHHGQHGADGRHRAFHHHTADDVDGARRGRIPDLGALREGMAVRTEGDPGGFPGGTEGVPADRIVPDGG